jgi:predicted nucleotidyltransferase
MLTQQNAIDISKKFIKELKDSGLNIRKAYLYGSFLDNRQHEYSDIDLAIVADEFIGVGPVDLKLFLSILRNYRTIHAKTYSIDDITEKDPFWEEIIKSGK